MARELRRLLIGRDRLVAAGEGPLPLTAEESRYLERVLRYRPGDGFAVVDGEGSLWTARLRDDRCADLEQPLAAPWQQSARPLPRLVLAAAVVKRDFEVVVRMAVELGVDAVIPLVCEHTAVQGQLRPERWRSIAAEAAEQCERLWQPEIAAPLPVAALLTQLPSGALQLWASARGDGRPELDALLEPLGPQAADAPTQVCLACGPEGGWSEGEELQAQAQGWQPVGLGPRILRSSTACVAGLSVISLWRARRWGC
jgi:16S rRNA (uracil1498-N3)-methyltransferase